MRDTKALCAVTALVVACCSGVHVSPALAMDEPDVEVEVIDIRALTLASPTGQQPALLLPRPHLPQAEANRAGAG